MKQDYVWFRVGFTSLSLVFILGLPLDALARPGDVRREFLQEMGEVRDARRDAIERIRGADSRGELRREIRRGQRKVDREVREMRREVRREIRREFRRY